MARSDRRAELFAAALIPYTAAAVALILRNVARRKTRVIMFWEDYLTIVAFVSLYIAVQSNSYARKGYRHRIYLHQPLQ